MARKACFKGITFLSLLSLVLVKTSGKELSQDKCTCEFTSSSSTLNIKCDVNTNVPHNDISKCFHEYHTSQELVFTDSFLSEIPTEINILQELTSLDLSRNQLRKLNIGHIEHVCNRIRILIVDYNNIHVLDRGSMDCLKNLNKFSIVNNSLSLIENGTFNKNLQKLEFIDIMHNSLTVLDLSVVILPNVITHGHIIVNASWNNIGSVTNSINVSITDIKRSDSIGVDLIHNNFTTIDIDYYVKIFHIANPIQLLRLWNSGFDLKFNPAICDCAMEPIAKALKVFRYMDPTNPLFLISCYKPIVLNGMRIYSVPLNEFNCSVTQNCPHGCSCIKTVSLQLITVTCDYRYNLTSLPDHTPNIEHLHINIKSGSFQHLSYRKYLTKTTLLDVSGCAIDTISNELLEQMMKIKTVYLHDNSLITFPREIEQIQFGGLRWMTLRGNPFSCDCHSLWFKKWLIQNRFFVSDVTRVLCASGPGKGTPIIEVKDGDFVCEHSITAVTTKELLVIVFSGVFMMILILLLIHYNRRHIQVLLIATCNIYCFRKKATGEFAYDVFISHSSKDDDWVVGTLMAKLESQQPPYKIFFDERDFQPGRTIVSNVIRAIQSSRTTLLVLTNHFLRSDWCMMEFKEAHLNILTDAAENFIVIVMEELDESLMGEELRFYLKTNVYIKYSDRLFWPKLLQAIPIANSKSVSDTSASSERSPLLVN